MALRDKLRRLERHARGDVFEIPQPDGTAKTFPASDGLETLLALIDGQDHPLAEAARNSPDPKWSRSFYAAFEVEEGHGA